MQEHPEQESTQQEEPPPVEELDKDPAHSPEDDNLEDLKGG